MGGGGYVIHKGIAPNKQQCNTVDHLKKLSNTDNKITTKVSINKFSVINNTATAAFDNLYCHNDKYSQKQGRRNINKATNRQNWNKNM